VVNALRRSERDALWSGLVPGSRNVTARFRDVVRVAASSLDPNELENVAHEATDPRSWWQISYNAACGYASVSGSPQHATRALTLLEQTLLRPGVHQLRAEWVCADPDLDRIRSDDRFTNFVEQLRTDT
jgi:predicted metalloprotease with PDZ domain